MSCEKHEFNSGFISALAKFLAHREQWVYKQKTVDYDLRIYGASDHLFDIVIPDELSESLKKEIEKFVKSVLKVRLEHISWKKGTKLFDKADKILQKIDKEFFKLKHVCSNYP